MNKKFMKMEDKFDKWKLGNYYFKHLVELHKIIKVLPDDIITKLNEISTSFGWNDDKNVKILEKGIKGLDLFPWSKFSKQLTKYMLLNTRNNFLKNDIQFNVSPSLDMLFGDENIPHAFGIYLGRYCHEFIILDIIDLISNNIDRILPLMDFYRYIRKNSPFAGFSMLDIILLIYEDNYYRRHDDVSEKFIYALSYMYLPKEFPFFWSYINKIMNNIKPDVKFLTKVQPYLQDMIESLKQAGMDHKIIESYINPILQIGTHLTLPIEVWTASHLNIDKRLNSLIDMIHSVFKFIGSKTKIFISLSHEDNVDISKLPKLDNVTYYFHDLRRSQFDHLQYIYYMRKDAKDKSDLIMPMDDDDLVTATPIYDINKLTISSQIWTKTDERGEPRRYRNDIPDFSGMIIPFYYVMNYFDMKDKKTKTYTLLIDKIDKSEEDVAFWTYYLMRYDYKDFDNVVEALKDIPPLKKIRNKCPYILHQELYKEVIKGDWREVTDKPKDDWTYDFASENMDKYIDMKDLDPFEVEYNSDGPIVAGL